MYVSELVLREIAAGDPLAAQQRLSLVTGIAPLALTPVVPALAKELVTQGAIPVVAAQDAFHLAIAAVNAIDYLLTWNCRHLANASMRTKIASVCVASGFAAPIICTPEELSQTTP
ncbi:MAG: type II toxin-antitoxin system VapC family toxin [Planctomycetes bacterium]|nr:type II toxin-antitoxin system VapC family toxin [Planctomycetota bacterium]